MGFLWFAAHTVANNWGTYFLNFDKIDLIKLHGFIAYIQEMISPSYCPFSDKAQNFLLASSSESA